MLSLVPLKRKGKFVVRNDRNRNLHRFRLKHFSRKTLNLLCVCWGNPSFVCLLFVRRLISPPSWQIAVLRVAVLPDRETVECSGYCRHRQKLFTTFPSPITRVSILELIILMVYFSSPCALGRLTAITTYEVLLFWYSDNLATGTGLDSHTPPYPSLPLAKCFSDPTCTGISGTFPYFNLVREKGILRWPIEDMPHFFLSRDKIKISRDK